MWWRGSGVWFCRWAFLTPGREWMALGEEGQQFYIGLYPFTLRPITGWSFQTSNRAIHSHCEAVTGSNRPTKQHLGTNPILPIHLWIIRQSQSTLAWKPTKTWGNIQKCKRKHMGETYINAKGNKSFPSKQNQWLDYKQAALIQRSMTGTPRYTLHNSTRIYH